MKRLLLWCLALIASGQACADAGLLERMVGGFSRDSLWKNVQERCLTPATPTHSDCVIVDRQRGFVLYKDMIGASHYLVIPVRPVSGVDDARVWSDREHNAWAFGWAARDTVGKAIGRALPDTLLGLAINARAARSPDQLHIHLDCISESARDFLASGAFDRQWRSLTFRGKPVRVRLIPSDDPVLAVDPFDVVREDLGADGKIADRGVFLGYVRPLQGQAGFVVVDEPVDKAGGANGHASDFLDRGCKLGRAQPGR